LQQLTAEVEETADVVGDVDVDLVVVVDADAAVEAVALNQQFLRETFLMKNGHNSPERSRLKSYV
jgi:hypothetical protein